MARVGSWHTVPSVCSGQSAQVILHWQLFKPVCGTAPQRARWKVWGSCHTSSIMEPPATVPGCQLCPCCTTGAAEAANSQHCRCCSVHSRYQTLLVQLPFQDLGADMPCPTYHGSADASIVARRSASVVLPPFAISAVESQERFVMTTSAAAAASGCCSAGCLPVLVLQYMWARHSIQGCYDQSSSCCSCCPSAGCSSGSAWQETLFTIKARPSRSTRPQQQRKLPQPHLQHWRGRCRQHLVGRPQHLPVYSSSPLVEGFLWRALPQRRCTPGAAAPAKTPWLLHYTTVAEMGKQKKCK